MLSPALEAWWQERATNRSGSCVMPQLHRAYDTLSNGLIHCSVQRCVENIMSSMLLLLYALFSQYILVCSRSTTAT